MPVFTPLNVEHSISRYLANKFLAEGYSVYWQDTGQVEGTGSVEVTLIREFPPTATLLISQKSTRKPGQVKVPAFSVMANAPSVPKVKRMGIGEGVFERTMVMRIDGFADTELQWYQLQTDFVEWFGPDVRITLYDQQKDITVPNPVAEIQTMGFELTQVIRRELEYDNAARYYLFVSTMATFIE